MRLSVLVLLALAFPGVSLGATGQKTGSSAVNATAQDVSDRSVKATGSSTGRALKDRFADVVNVRDFGAKGDGTTDDAAAFAAAIAAAQSSGAPLRIPKGTYRVTSPLTFTGIDVIGDGPANTGINCYGAGTCVTFNGSKAARFSGLTLTSKAAGQTGLVVLGSWLTVEHLEILGFDTSGLQVGIAGTTGTYYSEFRNIFIRNATTQGVNGVLVSGPLGGVTPPSSNANTFTDVVVNGRWTYLYRINGTKNRFMGGDCIPDTRGTGVSALWYIDGIQNEVRGSYSEIISGGAVPATIVTFSASSYSNTVVDLYLSYNGFNQTTHFVDLGWNNRVDQRPVGFNFQSLQNNVGRANLVPNSGFTAWTATEPVGWVAFSGTIARDVASTHGTASSLKITAAALNYNVSAYFASPAGGDKSLNQIPIGYFRGKQVTCGVWAKSAFAGIGNVRVTYDGTGGASYGQAHHSGSGNWEFLAASGLVPSDATKVGIALRASNLGGTLAGDVWYSEPVCVVGSDLPHYMPRALDDGLAQMQGPLILNQPITFADLSTTPSVAGGNFFKASNSAPTTITNFLDGRVGQELKILPTTANTTVANNANVATTTGAAKALSSGVIYRFIHDGTVWREF